MRTNEPFGFRSKLKNVEPLYTQLLNGKRVQEHKVSYVFDEVGCGKTVSAIIAMASILYQKINEKCLGEDVAYKILVVTPKSVCNQFEKEIKDKLDVNPLNVINIAFENQKVDERICRIKKQKQQIVVANPHKVCKLKGITWDLVIIDEAHDIVCNSYEQTYIYYSYNKYNRSTQKYEICNKIDDAYDVFLKNMENEFKDEDNMKKHFESRNDYIEKISGDNYALAQFAKSITIEEYYRYKGCRQTKVVEKRRNYDNKIFNDVCILNADKVMFLTATPYKYDKDFDFINYALVGTKITTQNGIIHTENFPDLKWVRSFYQLKDEGIENMKKANTSLMFKEIAQSISIKNKCDSEDNIQGKERKVEVWDEIKYEKEKSGLDSQQQSQLLKDKLLGAKGILVRKSDGDCKSRVIIFVSNSKEGQLIFSKIFPNTDYEISKEGKHTYTDMHHNITCEFIMNKFGNADNLKNYSKEPAEDSNLKVPDILIVTWQVAQVGINLPTYNYVINYHIPAVPGYLEQRYGRIDRLNSENNPLYNIYYLDDEVSTQVYRANLIQALWMYKNEIMDIPHNLPVKNLLLCKDLQVSIISCDELYKSLAYYIFSYFALGKRDKYLETINSEKDLFHVSFCENKGKVIVRHNNDIYEYGGRNVEGKEDDEINYSTNKDLIFCEDIKKHISTLIDSIKYYEKMNEMANALNDKELGDAGSIIFWNEEDSKVIVEYKQIIENIKRKIK